MKEIKEIINAFEQATAQQLQVALATVVHIEGSSYRRPGARMLVTENGHYTGAISGGCLEGDALRKAQLAIFEQKNKLVTYDTSDEDTMEIGVQLGCNGIIHILFEPIDLTQKNHPITLLSYLLQSRTTHVIGTIFNLHSKRAVQIGTCFIGTENKHYLQATEASISHLESIDAYVQQQFSLQQSTFIELADQQVFLEFVPPPIHVIIVGAGNDAIPLAKMAHLLGWEVTLVDGRFSHATQQRFPYASQIQIGAPETVFPLLTPDFYSVGVLMTHNYQYDLAMLDWMLSSPMRYVGSLGPRQKRERMLADLIEKGKEYSDLQLQKLFGPVGLDIGAETSEQIAVAIIAEIMAVMNQRTPTFLREKVTPIHNTDQVLAISSAHTTVASCAISQS